MTTPPASSQVTPEKEMMLTVSSPEKRIPKYCNSILFGKLDDGGIVMTFAVKEYSGFGEDKREDSVVIERIFVDKNHAKRVADALLKLCA